MFFIAKYLHISEKKRNFAAILGYYVSVRRNQDEKEDKTMARPIAETPILYGEEAERFLYNMQHVRPASKEKRERMQKAYEWMKSIATFPM